MIVSWRLYECDYNEWRYLSSRDFVERFDFSVQVFIIVSRFSTVFGIQYMNYLCAAHREVVGDNLTFSTAHSVVSPSQ